MWNELSLARACSWSHEAGMPALVPIIHDDVHYCNVNMMGHLTLITKRCLLQKEQHCSLCAIDVSCGWRRQVHGKACPSYT